VASTISFVGERLADAESITNWGLTQQDSGGGGWGAPTLNADKVVQGSNAISYNASNSNNQFWYLWFDATTSRGSSLDFSSGGANEGEVVYVWVQPQFPIQSTGNYNGEAGLGLMLGTNGTSSTNTAYWTFYGFENLPGGFVRLAVDPRKIPSASGASFSIADVDYVGVCMSISSTRNGVAAVYMDAIDVGSGLLYTGSGVGDGFQELVDYDQNTLNNRYGICEPLESTETVLGLRGSVFIGSGTATTDFVSNSKVVTFDSPKYFDNNGNYVNAVDSSFYKIRIQDGTSGSTNVRMGTQVSEGDGLTGRDGVTLLANSEYNYEFIVDSGVDSVNLYGCTIKNFLPNIIWNGITSSDLGGCFFDNNGQFQPDASTVIRNCSFLNCSDPNGSLLWASGMDIKNCSFIGNTNTDGSGVGIEHPEALTAIYDNLTFSSNDFDIYFSQVAAGDLIISATNGSDPTTAITGTPGNTVEIQNAVTLTITGIKGDGVGEKPSEVRIFSAGTKTELDGSENVTTGQFVFSYQGGAGNVDIRVFNLDYQPLNIFNFSLPATNSDLPIQQIFDRNYLNP